MWLVNGKICSSDYIVKQNDIIQSLMHRHEMPVIFQDIETIYEDEKILVINKPSGMPVKFKDI